MKNAILVLILFNLFSVTVCGVLLYTYEHTYSDKIQSYFDGISIFFKSIILDFNAQNITIFTGVGGVIAGYVWLYRAVNVGLLVWGLFYHIIQINTLAEDVPLPTNFISEKLKRNERILTAYIYVLKNFRKYYTDQGFIQYMTDCNNDLRKKCNFNLICGYTLTYADKISWYIFLYKITMDDWRSFLLRLNPRIKENLEEAAYRRKVDDAFENMYKALCFFIGIAALDISKMKRKI